MNYYSLNKFAQIENFLEQKGYSQQVLDATKKLSPAQKKELGTYVNANPNAKENEVLVVITDLAKLPDRPSSRKTKNTGHDILQPTDQEIVLLDRFSHNEFKSWAKKQMVLQRNQSYQKYQNRYQDEASSYSSWLHTNYSVDYRIYGLIYDWYQFAYLPAKEQARDVRDPQKLQEIAQAHALPDTYIQLNTLSYDDAVNLQEVWHETRKGRDAGRVYQQETASDIVYGPNWKLKKFNGWTIKKVTTDNNLKVEGHLMDHCVGDYCEKVTSGTSQIFSLRDPRNQPHVTMEVKGDYNFQQVYGRSNSEPKPEYKKAIGEWLNSLPNFTLPSEDYWPDPEYDTLDDYVKNRFVVEYKDYGVADKPYNVYVDILYDEILDTFDKRNKSYRYRDTNDGGPIEDDAAREFARGVAKNYKIFGIANLQNREHIMYTALNLARAERLYPQLFDQYKKRTTYDLTRVVKNYDPYYRNIAHDYLSKDKKDATIEKNKLDENIKILADVMKHLGESDLGFKRIRDVNFLRSLEKTYFKYNTNEISASVSNVDSIFAASAARSKYPSTEFPELHDLPIDTQHDMIRKAIDRENPLGVCLREMQNADMAQEHKIQPFDYWEPAPQEDDFEDTEDYEKALDSYEDNFVSAEREYYDEIRSNNLPFCFNDAVYEYLQKYVNELELSIPAWIVEYFANAKTSLPESLSFIQSNTKNDKTASGWYSLSKNSTM